MLQRVDESSILVCNASEWQQIIHFYFITYTDLWWHIQDYKFSYHRIANQATSISIRLRRAYVRCGEIMFEKLLNLFHMVKARVGLFYFRKGRREEKEMRQ